MTRFLDYLGLLALVSFSVLIPWWIVMEVR